MSVIVLYFVGNMSGQELFTIDAIDEDNVQLENTAGKVFTVPRNWLPQNAKEGDKIRMHVHSDATASSMRLVVDAVATAQTHDRIKSKLDILRSRSSHES